MSHRKIYECAAQFSIAFFAELRRRQRGARLLHCWANGRMYGWARKKAVRVTNGPSLGRKRPSGLTVAIGSTNATAPSSYELVRRLHQPALGIRAIIAGYLSPLRNSY
jgi:hypothetical protein